MRFINPKIDLVFKRIFGSEHSDGISHDFLDATRCYDSQGQITDLEILNPWAAPKVRGM